MTSVERLAALLPDWAWPPAPALEPIPAPDAPDDEITLVEALSWVAGAEPERGVGPLRGVRLAVKENIDVAGRPARAGSPTRDGVALATAHAPVVARLLGAGATLVGTCRMHELAFGVTGVNRADGTVAHPLDRTRIPGGSSSGSAVAVATGRADVALASDTGGSARIPAALTGVVGYKASRALAPEGVVPLAPTLDHLGWCTVDVATAARVAAALGLVDPTADPTADPTVDRTADPAVAAREGRPVLGVLRAACAVADPYVRDAVEGAVAAAAAAGADVAELDWPHLDLVGAVTTTVMFAEAAFEYGAAAGSYGRDVEARLRRGLSIDARAYLAARRLGTYLTAEFDRLTAGFDAVLAPTTGIAAPPLTAATRPDVGPALLRVTRLDDLTGRPALSLPIPVSGLPVGLHVTGPDDQRLLAVAGWLERVLAAEGQATSR